MSPNDSAWAADDVAQGGAAGLRIRQPDRVRRCGYHAAGPAPSRGTELIPHVDFAFLARRPIPVHPLLLAGYAVLFLYASNLSEADFGQVAPVLLFVVGIAAALLLAGAVVLRDTARAAILLSAFIAFFFGYRHVVILTAGTSLAGRPTQALWVLLGVVALVIAWRGGRALRTATRALNALGFGLVLVALIAIVPTEVEQFTAASTAAAAPELSPAPAASDPGEGSKALRDIWVLVFDRYGSAESLRLNYGIEEKLTPWLADRGFHITPDAHANYQRTSFSLASSLNLDYLEAVGEGRTIEQLLKDHAVGRFLTDLGYRYVHIGSQYEPTRTADRATVNRRLENTSDFATAMIDSSLAGTLLERLGYTKMDIRRQRQLDWAHFDLDAIDQTVNEPGPKFVFAHLLLPHPPYVFDERGNTVPDDVDAKRSTQESYEAQMRYLDTRIEALVDRLLDVPEEERPIIVLMADEGPYPKRYEGNPLVKGPDPDFDWSSITDEELRIKYGILHAMLLPGVDEGAIPDEMTSVNTFRFLLSTYFGADLPPLPNRILIPKPDGPGFDDAGARIGVEP